MGRRRRTIYHSLDQQFEVPEAFCRFTIRSPEFSMSDAKKVVLSEVYISLLNRHLSQLAEEAGQAGLHFAIVQGRKGLVVELGGYSEKILPLLQELASSVRNLHPQADEFVALKNKLAIDYRDQFNSSPLLQTREMATQLLNQEQCSNAQKNAMIKAITLQELTEFIQAIYRKTYIEGLVYGNLSAEHAVKVYTSIRQGIGGEAWPLKNIAPSLL